MFHTFINKTEVFYGYWILNFIALLSLHWCILYITILFTPTHPVAQFLEEII
jgi:hypothetical protein